jgi:hypothetical protein
MKAIPRVIQEDPIEVQRDELKIYFGRDNKIKYASEYCSSSRSIPDDVFKSLKSPLSRRSSLFVACGC